MSTEKNNINYQQRTFYTNDINDYWSYLNSIDWTDPWLICLVFVHLLITATALLTRNHGNFQMFLFLILLTMVYFSSIINEFAAQNWKYFSRQQYFDSNGLFISNVFSVPILLNCMLMIGTWLYNSTQLMSKIKIAQLRRENKTRKQNKADNNITVDNQEKEKSE